MTFTTPCKRKKKLNWKNLFVEWKVLRSFRRKVDNSEQKQIVKQNRTNNCPRKKIKFQTPSPSSSPPIAVRTMGMDENYSKILDENMALIESPLIAPSNSHFRQHYKTALYPYNITSHATQTNGGGYYSANEQDLSGNGDVDSSGYFNSVEKQSRYHPQIVSMSKIGVGNLKINVSSRNCWKLSTSFTSQGNETAWNVQLNNNFAAASNAICIFDVVKNAKKNVQKICRRWKNHQQPNSKTQSGLYFSLLLWLWNFFFSFFCYLAKTLK